ncbi:MAG: hypothetical protein HC915_10550 [Anaerolineae bacterium]|nr:hypothetical protein [Anaerolineae bacterium]
MQPFLGFVAEVPPMSARRYEIRFESPAVDMRHAPTAAHDGQYLTVENRWWVARFDARLGALVSLRQRATGRDLLQGPVQLMAMADTAHAWGGMDRAVFNAVAGVFEAMSGAELGAMVGEETDHSGAPVRVIHQGPLALTVECLTLWQHSRASLRYTFYADLPQVDMAVSLFMQARQKMIKLVLPFDLPGVQAACEVPYGMAGRSADSTEHAYNRWLHLRAPDFNVGLANDGQNGFDLDPDGTLRLSLTRGAVYSGWDTMLPLSPDKSYAFMDQERIDTTFRLIAGADPEALRADLTPLALALNQPLEWFFVYHPPSPPQGAPAAPPSFIAVEPPTIALGALKQAEDGRALIVRLYETAGQATTASICLEGDAARLEAFSPYQIKSWRVERDGSTVHWTPCNLIEEAEA